MTLSKAYKNYTKAIKKEDRKRVAKTIVGSTAALAGGIGASLAVANPIPAAASSVIPQAIAASAKTKANVNKSKLRKNNEIQMKDIKIEAGTIFQRVSPKEQEDLKDRIFVSYKKDKEASKYYESPRFLSWVANQNTDTNSTGIFKHDLVAVSDIYAPSLSKRKEIADKVINAQQQARKEYMAEYTRTRVTNAFKGLQGKTLNEIKKEKSLDAETKAQIDDLITKCSNEYDAKKRIDVMTNNDDFTKFMFTLGGSPPMMQKFQKELQKEGYNAVFDDNDASISMSSFIVFDPGDVFKETTSKKIADMDAFQ